MRTESVPAIGPPEQAAALKFRYYLLHKFFEGVWKVRRQDVEAVRGFFDEPLLERVGDIRRRPAQHPVTACGGGHVVEVSQRHLLAPRLLQQSVRKSLRADAERQVRHRPIERVARDIVAEPYRN